MSEREYSERPWGNYTVLDDDAPDHKVKRLVVHPGKRLSYQRHSKRAEHWFIVSGTAKVTLDGTVTELRAGESIDIPLEGAHRIANEGDTDVVFIEVQHGTYFGEDDIVRLEDDYGRVRDMTRIAELLAAGPTYSFEFFPPKNDKELATLARTISELQPLEPSFVSVTYRGGAESRQRTFDLVSGMLHTTNAQPHGPPHLRGPYPPGAGRHPGLAAQGRRREPDGARAATRPRTRRRAPASWPTPPSWWSWPAPSAASPSAWRRTRPGIPARPTCRATATSWRPSWRWPTSA